MTGQGSRIKGQGAILRRLLALVARVDKFGQHRVTTADDRRWANRLADGLEPAYCVALTLEAHASLTAVERRASDHRKTPGGICTSVERLPEPLQPSETFLTGYQFLGGDHSATSEKIRP